MDKRRILVIAGSDSSGGAGLEADQRVIAVHQCYAMTATTALTAQSTQAVYQIHNVPSAFVSKQIDACVSDIGVDVVKIGMLASAPTINAVATALEKLSRPTCVLDPVMVATSGAQLLPNDAVTDLRERLLPLTTILTPNIPEANLLLANAGVEYPEIRSIPDLVRVAKLLQRLGPTHVLIKGGHLPVDHNLNVARRDADKEFVIDVLFSHSQDNDEDDVAVFKTDFSPSKNTHGTGCSLASAIASNLALGHDVPRAVENACRYVERGIRTAPDLGKGSGPINHFCSIHGGGAAAAALGDGEEGESSLRKLEWG